MNKLKLKTTTFVGMALLIASTSLYSHGPGPGEFFDELMVTRHFTGAWDQVDQESQGLTLEVIEQGDNSRRAVAFWYTYGNDRKTAWYLGIGDLVEDRIEFVLHDSTNVGFMQDDQEGNDSVQSIGTMTIVFEDCNRGSVTFETDHEEVGSGSFDIERVSSVMNTHCSGGISDDMHVDGMFGIQRIELGAAREGIDGSGHARYEDAPGRMEFEVEVEGLADGEYHLHLGLQNHGTLIVLDGHGKLEFTSPVETGTRAMTFDPRGKMIEIHDQQGVVLSSFESSFERWENGQYGQGGHDGQGGNHQGYNCSTGGGPGSGMNGGQGGHGGHMGGGGYTDCVEDGEYIEIEAEMVNTGPIVEARGVAEWDMNSNRVAFSVEIEQVPVGSYPLKVDGVEVGIIEAFEMRYGGVYGRIKFRDPEAYGGYHLDFDPRGQKVEVFQGDNVILEVDFPAE